MELKGLIFCILKVKLVDNRQGNFSCFPRIDDSSCELSPFGDTPQKMTVLVFW